jgi:hypothetical protein
LSGTGKARPSATLHLETEAIITARNELAACFQLAALHGLEEGICNHFSAMLPGHDDLFLVNPYGYAFSEVTRKICWSVTSPAMWSMAMASPKRPRSTSTRACTNNCHG